MRHHFTHHAHTHDELIDDRSGWFWAAVLIALLVATAAAEAVLPIIA